ncbi:MAG TPA: family 10 glycosylhydrolase [Thermoanaerobaculia bacterium]|nr:family 10 glycosylhydrolase [Thermoanaerobaculia bacterium]
MPRALPSFVLALLIPAASLAAEYRAYWVETFNTPLGTTAEIGRVIDAAVASNANALFVQVRRRGDSWYLDSKEPLAEVAGLGEPDASGRPTIDPLRYLVEQAHARDIEVHAFVIVGSIFNADPAVRRPVDPNHVFNRHFWDPAASALIPVTSREQWATRALPHSTTITSDSSTSWNGQRFGTEWYIDPGHPDAAAYTVEVLTHLVSRYDVDGLHLDRIRYPEAPIDRPSGEPLGINVGYNDASVARFVARHGSAARYYTGDEAGYPVSNDPLWNQWRRDQVTALVRRIYLNATAVKPAIKVSAALITFWTGPEASGGFEKTEAHYRVFQDWESWAEEGILDVIAPMDYKREHDAAGRAQFDDWMEFTKRLARERGRHSLIGLGAFVNSVEGTLRQTRRALALPPFADLAKADGAIFYSLGSTSPGSAGGTNVAVTANPFSYPTAGQSTPQRPASDFFSALRTGSTVSGTRLEEPALTPVFAGPVATPAMSWKETPAKGHLMGFARLPGGVAADGASIVARNLGTGQTRTAIADGGGFYGFVDLDPGLWEVTSTIGTATLDGGRVEVSAGRVARGDLTSERPARRRVTGR